MSTYTETRNSFLKQNEIGKQGEKIVLGFIEANIPDWANPTDVSNIKYFQDRDIDTIIDFIKCEIKTDLKICETKNICLELANIRSINGMKKRCSGWFEKTEADIVYILDYNNKKLYALNIRDKNKILEDFKYCKKIFINKIDRCETLAYIIPISKLQKYGYMSKAKDVAWLFEEEQPDIQDIIDVEMYRDMYRDWQEDY